MSSIPLTGQGLLLEQLQGFILQFFLLSAVLELLPERTPFIILLQFLLPLGFFSSTKHLIFLIFLKILYHCYSLSLLGLHKNRPIRGDSGLINTNNSLDYAYQLWYNNSKLEVGNLY